MSQIESTHKSRDVEETIDLYFYRPIGYVVARICAALGITPNAVTIASIVIGVVGGHMLYYRDLTINGWGLVLWVVADILDSVDGQLARLTNNKSKLGRILDGFAGNLIFLSIYLHLLFRMVDAGGTPWLSFLVLIGGISHSIQSALADYYRNAYLKYVVDPKRSELVSSDEIRSEYTGTSFLANPIRKFMLRMYLNYTVEQEAFSKNFQLLRKMVDHEFGTNIPAWFSDVYRQLNKPLMKYYAILTTNTRMIVLTVCVLIDQVWLYFAAEVVGINLVMVVLTLYQERLSARLLALIREQRKTLSPA
jgi:phosphatidylglycerophosphate synthase